MIHFKRRILNIDFCVVCVWIIVFASVQSQDVGLVTRCKHQCTVKMEADAEEKPTDNWCNETCRILKCSIGCEEWERSNETCPTTCVGLCGEGCSLASDIHVQDNTGVPKSLDRPQLVPDSQTHQSVVLLWDPHGLPREEFHLQRRYVGDCAKNVNWVFHNETSWISSDKMLVSGLHPYCAYKFRFVKSLTIRHYESYPESVSIQTSAHGVPSGPPYIVSVSTTAGSIHLKWAAPFFTNGPLIGYRLSWKSQDSEEQSREIAKQDHTATAEVISHLTPDTRYEVKVAAINDNGTGMSVGKNVTTQQKSEEGKTAFLILASGSQVIMIDVEDHLSEPAVLCDLTQLTDDPSNLVEGIGVHFEKKKVFFSSSNGSVWALDKSQRSPKEPTRVVYSNPRASPSALTVDWLFNHLYIAERQQIQRCDLEGFNCRVVIQGLDGQPQDIQVDPCNGYLFWTVYGPEQGLFRADLADLQGKYPIAPGRPIYPSNVMQSFTVDYIPYRLYFPNSSNASMMSLYLDGRDAKVIHNNTQTSTWEHVTSLAFHQGLFYWSKLRSAASKSKKVYFEEYNPQSKLYFHSQMIFSSGKFARLRIWHPLNQPWPVPHMPPRELQALMSKISAALQWKPPALSQGEGAWSEWVYEVEAINLKNGQNQSFGLTKRLNLLDDHLLPDTSYKFRVRATSKGGHGPWSEFFEAATLKNHSTTPILVYSDNSVLGSAVYEGLLNGSNQNVKIEPTPAMGQIQDLEKCGDTLIWSSNFSREERRVFVKAGGRPTTRLHHVHNATAIAFDWLGNYIYWYNRKHNMIQRVSLDPTRGGATPETVFDGSAVVQDIVLDSLQGYIYWTTGQTLESSLLNGEGRQSVERLPLYAARFIFGLACDLQGRALYWLRKDTDKLIVFRATLRSHPDDNMSHTVEQVVQFDFNGNYGYEKSPPLQFYSGKLFLLNGPHQLYVMDTGRKSLARLNLTTEAESRVTAFCIDHPSKYNYPENFSQSSPPTVVPPPVNMSSLTVTGPWNGFLLSWAPSTVDYGEVTYKIRISSASNAELIHKETTDTFLKIEGIPAYSALEVGIQACTLWSCSEEHVKEERSPMTAPSVPLRPRAFVIYRRRPWSKNISIELEFRWSQPQFLNGIIKSFNLSYTINASSSAQHVNLVGGSKTTYGIFSAHPHSIYTFKVHACTQGHCGQSTEPVSISTSVEKPVPMLLTSINNTVNIFYPDDKKSQDLALANIVSLSFMSRESTLFYINKDNRIIMEHANNSVTEELVAVKAGSKSLVTDWVGRNLFWVEPPGNIRSFDLSGASIGAIDVLIRTATVKSLDVNPYHSSLYWTETNEVGKNFLLRSSLDGKVLQTILGASGNRKKRSCTCPELTPSEDFVIDHTKTTDTSIYVSDEETGTIWVVDMDGCQCMKVVDAEASSDQQPNGLPPDSMAVDQERLYWSNEGQKLLLSIKKDSNPNHMKPTVEAQADVGEVLSYGDHMQPMPDPSCLLVTTYREEPIYLGHTNTSLQLQLPEWRACEDVTHPTVKFTLYYWEIYGNATDKLGCEMHPCLTKETFSKFITLSGLKPYTKYRIQAQASNYYTDRIKAKTPLGQILEAQTKEGIPSAPRDVKAQPYTLRGVNVTWRVPAKPHAHPFSLVYNISWSSLNADGTQSEKTKIVDPIIPKGNITDRYHSYIVDDLESNHTYFFKVLASDHGQTGFSVSEEATATTYDRPNDIILLDRTSTSLLASWTAPSDRSIHSMHFQCGKASLVSKSSASAARAFNPQAKGSGWSASILTETEPNKVYNGFFEHLDPNTEYYIRIRGALFSKKTYVFPEKDYFKFTTEADCPRPPSPPTVLPVRDGSYVVSWNTPNDGGSPVLLYNLLVSTIPLEAENWTMLYNGSETQWLVNGLDVGQSYIFRVTAMNRVGWSDHSLDSSIFVMEMASKVDDRTIILGACLGGVALLVLIILALFMFTGRRYKTHKPVQLVNGVRGHSPDYELATLRELPHVQVQTSNALYAINVVPTDADVAALPHFRRDQLALTKFLGSGAFGEVFQGAAKNILSEASGETKVAVKTLRKGATDQEKEEFLKEALLMSNFKHDHIIRLLGVCLDNDPQFIILELMEKGDLLSYLRLSRPTTMQPPKLSLPDMVSICVDVAKGCKYLEDMHFVHRDLAARNCLVSMSGDKCVVKIGDFGLARDIYKNDYYRKEGEGLLPVRWMSPESLVDGIFTTLSDIWAFGVLMWEVLTLGQQPYPARTNLEVLQFVRNEGCLDRPDNCPDDLYHLMGLCWSAMPEKRPSFAQVLLQLEDLQRRSLDPDDELSGRNMTVGVVDPPPSESITYATLDALLLHANNPPIKPLPRQSGISGATRMPHQPPSPPPTQNALLSPDPNTDDYSAGEETPGAQQGLAMLLPNLKPSKSWDMKTESSEYMEPLVPPATEYPKYLELIEAPDQTWQPKPTRRSYTKLDSVGDGDDTEMSDLGGSEPTSTRSSAHLAQEQSPRLNYAQLEPGDTDNEAVHADSCHVGSQPWGKNNNQPSQTEAASSVSATPKVKESHESVC